MSHVSKEVSPKSFIDIICERTGAKKVPFMYEVSLADYVESHKNNQKLECGNINESRDWYTKQLTIMDSVFGSFIASED